MSKKKPGASAGEAEDKRELQRQMEEARARMSETVAEIKSVVAQQYDEVSQRTVLRLLREQWGIEGTLNRDKSYYRVRLSVAGTRMLAKLITPHLLPELTYKLPQVTP